MAKKKNKVVETNPQNSDLLKRVEGFSFRFNIDVLENGRSQFRNRCISAIGEFIGSNTASYNYVALAT